jgi:hypothetical protein
LDQRRNQQISREDIRLNHSRATKVSAHDMDDARQAEGWNLLQLFIAKESRLFMLSGGRKIYHRLKNVRKLLK